MFGAGGGTSSYEELRESADLIVLWGSNAREAHPIFFHHVLKAMHRGASLIVVDAHLDDLARRAVTQAGRLDDQEAPAREVARQKKERDDALVAAAKARAANKAVFRP